MRTVRGLLLVLAIVTSAVIAWQARRGQFDVDIGMSSVETDTTNEAIMKLSHVLKANPGANRFRIQWVVRPQGAQGYETLPRALEYNRQTGVLNIHKEMTWYEHYENVTNDRIVQTARRLGSAQALAQQGCRLTFPKE